MTGAREHSQCAAHGCPMLGTVTNSTNGSSEWWCFCHHGKSATHFQAITAELNRLHWLVAIAKDVRHHRGAPEWPDVYRKLKHEITLNQRSDLHAQKGETVTNWLLRLEKSLFDATQPSAPVPLIEKAKEAAGLKKVEFQQFTEEC